MPSLIILAVCERTILDRENNVSLINLLQGLNVKARPDASQAVQPLPRNSVAPKDWSIFSFWKPEQEDFEKPFQHVLQVLWPDQTEFKRHTGEVRFAEGKSQQVAINIVGFPVGQAGDITVNVWLESNSHRVGNVHSWVVKVEYAPNVRNK